MHHLLPSDWKGLDLRITNSMQKKIFLKVKRIKVEKKNSNFVDRLQIWLCNIRWNEPMNLNGSISLTLSIYEDEKISQELERRFCCRFFLSCNVQKKSSVDWMQKFSTHNFGSLLRNSLHKWDHFCLNLSIVLVITFHKSTGTTF